MTAARTPRRWPLWAAGALGLALVGAGAAVLGPAGPPLVGALADGRTVWRLGVLDVEAVSGAHLGDLRIGALRLQDADGAWIELADVRVRWSPLALLAGRVDIAAIDVGDAHVRRRPVLGPAPPPAGAALDLDLAVISAPSVRLDAPVLGQAGVLRLEGGAAVREGRLAGARLDLARTDAGGDRLALTLAADPTLAFELSGESPPGGLAATALGLGPGAGLTLAGRGGGDPEKGDAQLRLDIGGAQALTADLVWRPADWRLAAQADLAAAPALAPLTERLGPAWTLTAAGTREAEWAGPAELALTTPAARLTATGRLDDGLAPEGPIALRLEAPDVARLAPGAAGALTVTGAAERAGTGWTFAGRLEARGLAQGLDAAGPLTARWAQDAATLEADLTLAARSGPAAQWLSGGRLRAELAGDPVAGRLTRLSGAFDGPQGRLTAEGDLAGLTGAWRLTRLEALGGPLRGAAAGGWTARAAEGWRLRLSGVGVGVSGWPEPFDQLLGPAPRLDAEVEPVPDGLTVRAARLTGPGLRLGAEGTVRNGNLDLALEASAQGPVRLGETTVAGAGRLTGPAAAPRLTATASFGPVDLGGTEVRRGQAALTFDLATRTGALTAEGVVADVPARVSARLAPDGDGASLEDVALQVAGLRATGALAPGRVDLELAGRLDGLGGAQGAVTGRVRLARELGRPRLTADLLIQDGRLGAVAADTLRVTMDGPLLNARTRYALTGQWGAAPLRLEGEGAVGLTAAGWRALLSARGSLADTPVTTRELIRLQRGVDQTQVEFSVGLQAGRLGGMARLGGPAPAVELVAEALPLGPLAAVAGERASGALDGRVRLTAQGPGLVGEVELALTEARFARRVGDPLTGAARLALAPDRLTGSASLRSAGGFLAELDLDAPVLTDARAVRIAPDPARQGAARWRASGRADALWALTGILDQALDGDVVGAGALTFGGGNIAGGGGLTLRNGRFEDRASGLRLNEVAAELAFDDRGARLTALAATDGRGGRLTGAGTATGLREGEVALQLADLQLVNRPEARVRADGALTVRWDAGGAVTTGALTITEAVLTDVLQDAPPIPTLEVVEINRPAALARTAAPTRAIAPRLDLTVKAPRRLLTRARGASAEWSLDARVTGDARAPLIAGEARLLRGDFTLAGRRFDVTEGRIAFAGTPEAARLTLLASRVDPDLTARIVIGGTLAAPEVRLESEPALPEDEILPRLLFGRDLSQLSAVQAAQLAASLSALAGGAAFDVADAARRAVGLDRLDVREGEAGVLLAGGRYLTQDVYVELAGGQTGQASSRIEWRVRPQLTLVTSFLANGDRRASIRWRREY